MTEKIFPKQFDRTAEELEKVVMMEITGSMKS